MPTANSTSNLAVIELGSNAIRLLIANKKSKNSFTPLTFKRISLRLGSDVFKKGFLTQKTIIRLCKTINSLQKIADKYQAKKILVATSAIRESKNKKQIKKTILNKTGLKLNIISGKAEAAYALTGIKTKVNVNKGNWLIGDLGGGTLQLNALKNGKLLWNKSFPFGVVRLIHKPLAQNKILTKLQKYNLKGYKLIFTGGGMDAVAKMLKIKTRPAKIKINALKKLQQKIARLSAKQIEKIYKLPPDRADVIKPGIDIYLAVATACQTKEILIPYAGIREGIIIEMLNK